jgi:glutamate 5-kinase
MNEFKRIVVKIGSNVLARADGTLDITRISALVDQITSLHASGIEVIMVTSGAVASGRSEMKGLVSRHLDSVSQRQLYSAVGQAKLINRYYEFFRDHGIVCGQILTTKENFATRESYLNQKHCMDVMLNQGVIPVINENDTISVTELMFTDNDELSGLIASMMDAQALIILSNIDGVFDGNPADSASRLIPEISATSRIKAESFVQPQKSSFGRGGMATKYAVSRKLANEGIAVFIANGKRDDILLDVLSGRREVPFTLFKPSSHPVSGVKKWIAHSEDFAKGEIHINECVYKVLLSPSPVSLLPVGVTKVVGDFEKGDIVRIIAPDGSPIGVGRAAVDSRHAAEVAGQQGGKPIIHYNYLYMD